MEIQAEEYGAHAEAIREQLDRILSSPHFRNSKRSQALLRFVTEGALENRLDDLREKIIGSRVFGREEAYDTTQDGVVRGAAGEVRKRLAQYYLEGDHSHELRIELSAGSYVPSFIPAREKVEVPDVDSIPAVDSKQAPTRKPPAVAALGVGVAVLLIAAGAYLLTTRGGKSDFDRFWAPVLTSDGPVRIVVGQPSALYRFVGPRNTQLTALFREPSARPDSAHKVVIGSDEISRVTGRCLYTGDAFAMTKLGALVQAKGREFRLTTDTATNYSELRDSFVIVIGASNNSWTRRLVEGTRFSFVPTECACIADANEPTAQKWTVRNSADSEDYAIITRVLDPNTQRTVVLVAGIYDPGTQAASEFVTNPAYMNAALRNAPRGWERHNMQLVLHTKIIAGTPGSTKVVAMHFW